MLSFQADLSPFGLRSPASPHLQFGAGVRRGEEPYQIAYSTFKRGGPPTDAITEVTNYIWVITLEDLIQRNRTGRCYFREYFQRVLR
jgi:hypothetical protein